MSRDFDQTTRLLARILVHGGEVLAHVGNGHLARELRESLESLMKAAIADDSDTASLILELRRLRSHLEDIGLVSGAPLAQLLFAERHVLLLELHLGTERVHAPRQVPSQKTSSTPKSKASIEGVTRESLEQVLAFVVASGPVQARDIIAGCEPRLSERTVKRRIKDLVKSGHLRKEERNGILLYTANP